MSETTRLNWRRFTEEIGTSRDVKLYDCRQCGFSFWFACAGDFSTYPKFCPQCGRRNEATD